MKNIRKVLSIFLVIALVLSLIPVSLSAFAEDANFGYCGVGGSHDASWSYDPDTKVLTISGTGEIECNSGTAPSTAETVIFEEGITAVPANFYCYHSSLKHVQLSDTVTEIGDSSFDTCSNLESFSYGNGPLKIGKYAFAYCSKLDNVYLRKNVSIDEGAFQGCKNLKNLTLEEGITTIEKYAFAVCESLAFVKIPGSVKNLGTEIFNFNSLVEAELGDGITVITYNMFRQSPLKPSLKTIIIPKSVIKVDEGGFSCCDTLEDVYYGGTEEEWANVEIADYNESLLNANIHFNEEVCDHTFTKQTYPATCTAAGHIDYTCSECGMSYSETTEKALGHDFGEWIVETQPTGSTTGLKCRYCSRCDAFESQIMPDLSRRGYLGGDVDEDAMWVYNPDNKTLTITGTGELLPGDAFGHSVLPAEAEHVIIGEGITNISDHLFYDCKALKTIQLSSTVKSIDTEAFQYCTNLETIDLCNVQTISMYAFQGCTKLNNITISKSIESIGDGVFYNCTGLENITFEEGTTSESLSYIGGLVFGNCKHLKRIVLPDSLKSFDRAMLFVECPELVYVDLGGITSIPKWTFSDCPSLESITISDEVTSIAALTFQQCPNFKEINYRGTQEDWEKVNVETNAIGTGTRINFVSDSSTVSSYEYVLYGDVNGDKWYDGADSIIVGCLANGLLSREQVGEAAYAASDCNHDGVVDENDVAILEQAGIILASVDQSKAEEELILDSAYIEYLSLIDQNPEKVTEEAENTGINIIQIIIDFIVKIFNLIKSFILKF